MPRTMKEFWASPAAQEHMLGKHAVFLDEALEAAESSPVYKRVRDGGGERRYVVAGKTGAGRRLWVIFADEGAGRGRLITAREAHGRRETSDHRQMRGD